MPQLEEKNELGIFGATSTHTHTHKYYDYDDDPVREKEKGRETNHKMLDRVSSLSLSRSRS